MPDLEVIYAASVMHEDDFSRLFNGTSKLPGQQAQKFNCLIVNGIEKNGLEVRVISAPPVTQKNTKSRFIMLRKRKQGNVCYKYLPIFNFSKIKNVIVLISSFLSTFVSSVGKKTAVVCDILNVSVAMGAVLAGRFLKRPCIGIVTDIPELMVTGHLEKQVKYCYKIIDKCTGYVFLTEAMNDRLNPHSKPYVIIEGICDCGEQGDVDLSPKNGEKICFYAGLLDAKYGVKNMVEGFLLANINDAKLHICGKGPYTNELIKISSENPSVEYLGVLMNQDVIKLEKEAFLLINPRPSTEEFTKYSFPSKNMEYMASGTPVLTTKLPGMPSDHLAHVFLIDDESPEGIKNALIDVFSRSSEELYEFGIDSKRFVMENKNNIAQAAKLIGFIRENSGM